MSESSSLSPQTSPNSLTSTTTSIRGNSRPSSSSRGRSRGGLGKYLRARGRGHRGGGRPAEFGKRLLLPGEGPSEDGEGEEEEEQEEERRKYARRNLGSNAERYVEPEPELDSDGEPIVEPEIDLSSFLAKQRLHDESTSESTSARLDSTKLGQLGDVDEDDVDHTLDHLPVSSSDRSKTTITPGDRKGKTQEIEWDDEFEDLLREKNAAEATRDLKNRFRAKTSTLRSKPAIPSTRDRKQELAYVEAPPLPLSEGGKPKSQMDEMEDFLDELLG